ncbi:MAG TPA: protein translocase subunit SecF [Gemmatimonadaceae bacterium]|jgi:protein-export membrane protein, SecD/SecF family/protein-export membrane protein SecF
MFRILHDTKIDFIRLWKITTTVTLLFIIPGLILLAFSGYRYSIEFTGGTLMQVSFKQPPDVAKIRATVQEAGIPSAEIAQFGGPTEFVIRAQNPETVAEQTQGSEVVKEKISAALTRAFGDNSFEVTSSGTVSAKVGSELRQKAALAVFISFFITLAYLAYRFEWRFGLAAVIATSHDILATLVFIRYLNLEISLIVVGGVLTMIGYSLNDTIIIFDRAREDLRKKRKETLKDTLNRAVNETLPRSVLTHTTTVATLLALAVLGGPVIRPFSLVMLFGVATGTFSSIYVAPVILLWIEHRWPRKAGERAAAGHRATRLSEEGGSSSSRKEPSVAATR